MNKFLKMYKYYMKTCMCNETNFMWVKKCATKLSAGNSKNISFQSLKAYKYKYMYFVNSFPFCKTIAKLEK